MPEWRLFVALVQTIKRSGLREAEKWAGLASLVRVWAPKYWKKMVKEMKSPVGWVLYA
jgi:hypothetical protein